MGVSLSVFAITKGKYKGFYVTATVTGRLGAEEGASLSTFNGYYRGPDQKNPNPNYFLGWGSDFTSSSIAEGLSFWQSTNTYSPFSEASWRGNSYYGFGLALPNSPVATPTAANKQLYNGGSEWQNDFGNLPDLQQTFYRNYDAALGRFIGVDPEAEASESLTGYQYGDNNPIIFNDPMGNNATPPLHHTTAEAINLLLNSEWGAIIAAVPRLKNIILMMVAWDRHCSLAVLILCPASPG